MVQPWKKPRSMAVGLLVLAGAVSIAPAQAAGGPYVVETATYLQRDTAEFSLWHSAQRKTSFSANHAELVVRPTRNWQYAAELFTLRGPDNERESGAVLQAKTLWAEPWHDGYGAGLLVDLGYNSSEDRIDNGRLTVPVTVEAVEDRLTLHLNAGADYLRDDDDATAAAWGAAADVALTERWLLITEFFGDTRGERPEVQSGLRWWLGQGELSVDLAWRRTLESGANEIWTLGASLRAVEF